MNEDKASKESGAPTSDSKQSWNRSDKIAMAAFLFSILSVGITLVATKVAYTADQRALQSDVNGAEAVVVGVREKVQLLAQSAEYGGMFLEAFIANAQRHPENVNHVELLTFELLQKLSLPDFSFSTEQLTLLAHSDTDAAGKLEICSTRRAEVEADIKSVATAKKNKLTLEQVETLKVLPYRLHKLSEACNQATKSLEAIVPALPAKNEPLRGTLGEIMDAEETMIRRKNSGLNATLEVPKTKNRQNTQASQKPTASNN
jgi:hypothetical protein